MVWVSLTYTDAQTRGSGHGGLSDYPQHVEILTQGVGTRWTSLAYMDAHTGSLGHGGHPWHTWMFIQGVWAWWTSLDCLNSACLLTRKSKVNITVLAMCGLQYINIHVFSPSILLALVLCAQ